MSENKINNCRILPTGNKIFKNKKFNIETLAKLQIESNWTDIEVHRYIKLDSINYTKWAKELDVSPNTLKKNIQMLILLDILRKFKGEDGKIYYKICGHYEDGHVLFEERFLRKLLNIGSKNLIKIYLIYYKYSRSYESCMLNQNTVLEYIGFSPSGKNKAMLRDINDTLIDLGLVEIETIRTHEEKVTRTMLKVTAPTYYETKFYADTNKN